MLSQPLELKHWQIAVLSNKHFCSCSAEFWTACCGAVHEQFLSLMSWLHVRSLEEAIDIQPRAPELERQELACSDNTTGTV